MASTNIVAALQELALLERDFARAYVAAALRSQKAQLAPDVKAGLHRMRDELYGYQSALRAVMVPSAIWRIPLIASRIPAPVRWPDLPSPGQPLPAEFQVSGGSSMRGLGALPVVIVAAGVTITLPAVLFFAAVAVVVLGAAAAIAYTVYVSAELVRRIVGSREITRRYDRAINAAEKRYNDCRSGGGTADHCNTVAPIPEVPTTDVTTPIGGEPAPGWMWAVGGVAGVAVLFGAVYAYSKGRSTVRRLPRTAAEALTSGD